MECPKCHHRWQHNMRVRLDIAEMVHQYDFQGWSIRQIAIGQGVSFSTARRHLHAAGVVMRERGIKHG